MLDPVRPERASKGKRSMGKLFGTLLREHRETRGLSQYRLALDARMPQSNLSALERGDRRPSDKNLLDLSAAEGLGLSLEKLQAWRALDEIGEEGIALVKTQALDVFLEVLPGAGEAEHPPTEEERVLIAEARQWGVWTTEIDNPDLWHRPPDDEGRCQIFEYLGELVEDARRFKQRRQGLV
jgi:transcriptional regulator with XRE-family HTH domain